jgi:hypothetical protein
VTDRYYYLISSLPLLVFGARPPISKEAFFAECGKWLDTKKIDGLREWGRFDLGLKEEIAAARSSKKEGSRGKVPVHLKDVFEAPNPLEAEKKIEKIRWDFLEEKGAEYHFDINFLKVYLIKLRILERLASFDKERGSGKFEGLCEVKYE